MNLKESNWLDQLNRILIYPVYWIFESSGLLNFVHCWYLHRKNWSMCAWCTMNLISRHFQTKNQSFALYNVLIISMRSRNILFQWIINDWCVLMVISEKGTKVSPYLMCQRHESSAQNHWFNGYLLLKGMSFFFKSDFQVQCQENNSNFRNQ